MAERPTKTKVLINLGSNYTNAGVFLNEIPLHGLVESLTVTMDPRNGPKVSLVLRPDIVGIVGDVDPGAIELLKAATEQPGPASK